MHIRRDAFGEGSETIALGAFERAAVLYNLGALQASLAGTFILSSSVRSVCGL
jgi:hypothetical protein